MSASRIRSRRGQGRCQNTHWRCHLDEIFVRVTGDRRYLWRAVDHEGEVLESFVTTRRDKAVALKFLKKALKRHAPPWVTCSRGGPVFSGTGFFSQQDASASSELQRIARLGVCHG